MHTIKVGKAELLKIVMENREKHRNVFLEAMDGYRAMAIRELDSMIAEAKAGRKIRRAINLVEPVDQTREYDRIIRMLQMSTEPEIPLEEAEFAQYVQDDWHWKRQFVAANRNYAVSSQSMSYFDGVETG